MDTKDSPSQLKQITGLMSEISGYVAVIVAYLLAIKGLVDSPFPRTVAVLTVLVTTSVSWRVLWPQVTRKKLERPMIILPVDARPKQQPAWKKLIRIFDPSSDYSMPHPNRIAWAASLVVLTIFSGGFLGSNISAIYREISGLDCLPRKSGDLRVIIADFDKSDSSILFEKRLMTSMKEKLGEGRNVCRYRRVISDSNSALELGEQYRAIIVIWGSEDEALFQVIIDAISWENIDEEVRAPAKDKIQFEVSGLDEIPYMTQYVLSAIFYMEKNGEARQELERGIASAVGQDWVNEHPDTLAEGYFFLGYLYSMDELEAPDPWQAISAYTEAIRLNPGYDSALINRGFLYMDMGELKLAAADFTAVIERDSPEANAAYTDRGHVRLEQKDYTGAVADFSEARKRTSVSNDPFLLYDMGMAQVLSGDFPGAEQTFKEAIPYLDEETRQEFILGLQEIGQARSELSGEITRLIQIIEGE